MSNSAAARPSSGGTGIRSFFSKLRKPSDLQMSTTQRQVARKCLADGQDSVVKVRSVRREANDKEERRKDKKQFIKVVSALKLLSCLNTGWRQGQSTGF
ncbi:hypothetical protein Tcan_01986 [Toxocara canis]|uniref:Uncharacterized protein n=1 Tax=Toxocara canis TaxID=6265 RepID=A0A0B2VHE5_TOXCA|nr:hypothetical protein Tcan_01986 [Toxocara canis]